MAEPSGFLGFTDILKGLSVVPKIIMFLGIVLLLVGFFSGRFSLLHNPKLSCGVGLAFAALACRDWEEVRPWDPNPPSRKYWDFGKLLHALFWSVLSLVMFYITYRA